MKIIDHEAMKCVFVMCRDHVGMIGRQVRMGMSNDDRVAPWPHPDSDDRSNAGDGGKDQEGRRLTDLRAYLPGDRVGDQPAAVA